MSDASHRPHDPRRPLLVVIPAYNEAETIEEVTRRSLVHADVCVVDDCSTDDTAALAEAIDGVHVVRHTQNTHIAGALLNGMRYAREHAYDYCVTMDAGLSHDPDVLPEFQAFADADLVLGMRAEVFDAPRYRRALSFGATALINMALDKSFVPFSGPGIRDATSGYRMYSRRAYELLLDAPMQSRSFDFHLEALAYVYRAGFVIREAPITYQFSNSSLRPEIVTEALRTCARLWREDFKVPAR
jgi:dolichol-phosphate mannosyltransferase